MTLCAIIINTRTAPRLHGGNTTWPDNKTRTYVMSQVPETPRPLDPRTRRQRDGYFFAAVPVGHGDPLEQVQSTGRTRTIPRR